MRALQSTESNGLINVWACGNAQVPSLGGEVWHGLFQQTLDLLHHFASFAAILSQVEGMRNQSQGWLEGLWCFVMPPQLNVPWMCPCHGGGIHTWASFCEGGWVFTACDQRLCHTPKILLFPLAWGAVCANLASPWAVAFPWTLQRWFSRQLLDLAFLGYIFLSLSPRPSP